MAGMVLRALRPAGDHDKEPRSQLFGAAKTPHLFAPEHTARTRRPCGAENTGQQKSAALTSRQGFDARLVFPAGRPWRRGAGHLSGTVL